MELLELVLEVDATAQLQTTSTSKLTDSIARVCLCYSRSFCFLVDALVLTDSTESIRSWKLCRSSFYLSLPRLSGRAHRSIEHSCICVYTDCTHATYLSSNQNNAKESEYTTLHKWTFVVSLILWSYHLRLWRANLLYYYAKQCPAILRVSFLSFLPAAAQLQRRSSSCPFLLTKYQSTLLSLMGCPGELIFGK